MPTMRFSKLGPEAQRRILDAARSEFVQHGYADASINQIVQAAASNKGSLYYYFEDKADLFVTVVRDAQEEMIRSVYELNLDQLLKEPPPEDFWGFLLQASVRKIAFAVHHPDLTRLGSELFREALKPGAPASFKEFMKDLNELLCEFFRMGQAQGAVRQDLPLGVMAELSLAVSEIMNRALLEDPSMLEGFGPEQIRRYGAEQVDMMRRMLSAPKGDATS